MQTPTQDDRSPIGFIGLGAMGAPMARALARQGFDLVLFDSDSARTHALSGELGARPASDPAELGQACRTVITMLPNSDVVEAVIFGPRGLAEGLAAGATVIEMSSGIPARTRAIHARLADQGAHLFDAPVSGGVARARTGELAIMLGGDEAGFEALQPILQAMGSSITPTGPVGSAHAMKALNNLVSAGGFLIGIEALLIGQRFGLDPARMVDILNASTGMNNSTQKKFRQFVLSRSFDSGFSLDLMAKDLGIALAIAQDTGTTAPFASLCRDLWRSARAVLGENQDHTALARYSEILAGSTLAPDSSRNDEGG